MLTNCHHVESNLLASPSCIKSVQIRLDATLLKQHASKLWLKVLTTNFLQQTCGNMRISDCVTATTINSSSALSSDIKHNKSLLHSLVHERKFSRKNGRSRNPSLRNTKSDRNVRRRKSASGCQQAWCKLSNLFMHKLDANLF